MLELPQIYLILIQPCQQFLKIRKCFDPAKFTLIHICPDNFLTDLRLFCQLRCCCICFFFHSFRRFIAFSSHRPYDQSQFLCKFKQNIHYFFKFPVFTDSVIDFVRFLPDHICIRPECLIFVFKKFSPA